MAETDNYYTDSEEDYSEDIPPSEPRIPLRSGEAMRPEEVETFLLAQRARMVAIIGESYSGKTTLLASLYERFTKGPFAALQFAGSRTIVGFEKRLHLSRVESGATIPDTDRTSFLDGLVHYHLALAPANDPGRKTHLLLADRAGEAYEQARADSNKVAGLAELRRAARIVLLLDGSKLAEQAERAGAMQNIRQLLRALTDGGMLDTDSHVQIVTTKLDLLERAEDYKTLAPQLVKFRDQLTISFREKLRSLTFWDIAARDPRGKYMLGHGLDALLSDWITPEPVVVAPGVVELPMLVSELDRLLRRTKMDILP